MPTFLHGFDILAVQPWYEVALGGYRVMVSEYDLADAFEVLREARQKPLLEGERLVIRHFIAVPILTILTLVALGWIGFLPLRGHEWRSVNNE